jgi:aldehyde dehydrogenase (NAD+)
MRTSTAADYEKVMQSATKLSKHSERCLHHNVVEIWCVNLRGNKEALGKLVSYEMGNHYKKDIGSSVIDICDFLTWTFNLMDLTMHSERPGHRMYEQYHPMGTVGIISSNFPSCLGFWALAWFGDVCV